MQTLKDGDDDIAEDNNDEDNDDDDSDDDDDDDDEQVHFQIICSFLFIASSFTIHLTSKT